MRRVKYNSAALRDLTSIVAHVSEQGGSRAAARLAHAIRLRCREIASLPGTLGRSRPELGSDVRSMVCGNYVVFFRYEDRAFIVINVLHGHRDIDAFFHSSDDKSG